MGLSSRRYAHVCMCMTLVIDDFLKSHRIMYVQLVRYACVGWFGISDSAYLEIAGLACPVIPGSAHMAIPSSAYLAIVSSAYLDIAGVAPLPWPPCRMQKKKKEKLHAPILSAGNTPPLGHSLTHSLRRQNYGKDEE